MNTSSFFEGLPILDEESNEDLKFPLTVQELYIALMSMENGKSPGIDGLPIEFNKHFWPILGEDLLAVFNESLIKGFLPLSCRRAVITLLPKKGDLQNIKNWRPVSLLCSEYKILSKVLATRLSKVVGKVILSRIVAMNIASHTTRGHSSTTWTFTQLQITHRLHFPSFTAPTQLFTIITLAPVHYHPITHALYKP